MKSTLSIALLILSISYAACSVLHVPLTRTKTYTMSLDRTQSSVNPSCLSGNISLGTPPQNFTIFFDTTSTDFWVVDTDCSDLEGRNAFNSTASSTYEPASAYLDDFYSSDSESDSNTPLQMAGYVGLDTLNIGGAHIKEVFFGQASEINDLPSQFDGVLGLAFQQIGLDSHTSSMEDILRNKQFSNKSISLYVSENSSALILGGVDMKYAKSSFQYIPVIGDGMWSFIGHLNVGSVAIAKNLELMIDTSYSGIIFFPIHIYRNFMQITGLNDNQVYQADIIDVLRPIEIVTKSGTLTIPSSAYIIEVEGVYINIVRPQYTNPTMVLLGDMFLERYYTHFDYENERIGFAEAANI